jgi:hypothetical protein
MLSPDEKERLDEWYIRNASLWLDLRIAVMTALMFVRGRPPHPARGTDRLDQHPADERAATVGAHRPFVPTRKTSSKEPAVPAAAILSLRGAPSFGSEMGSDRQAPGERLAASDHGI